MAFTKITAAGIGSTETVTLDGLSVINNGSFGGNLTVGGVLTYEDVTNVDSVGLITARNGIVVGSGITLSKDGDIFATGITTVSGNVKVGTGITLSPDGDGFFTGVVTATSFVGDGSGLTNAGPSLTGSTNNTIVTVTGANAIQGESNLQFDGAHLTQAVQADAVGFDQTASGNHYIDNIWNANRTIAGSAIGRLTGQWNGTEVASIKYIAGSDTTNKDDAHITFFTATSGSSNAERLRITSEGRILVGHTEGLQVNSGSHRLQIVGTNFTASGISQQRYEAGANGASLLLAHSRGGTVGGNTALQSGDELGKIRFIGSDGTDMDGEGAEIVVTADGNFSSNSVPTKFAFKTTPNGSNSPTTRMTIDQNGYVKIGTTAADAYHMIKLSGTTTNAIKNVLSIDSSVTGGTAADGFGSRLLFGGEHLNGNNYTYGGIAGKLSTTGSNYGHLSFYTNNNGTLAEKMRLTDSSSGQLQVLGNSASVKTIESGGATVVMASGGSQGYVGTETNHHLSIRTNNTVVAEFTESGDLHITHPTNSNAGQILGILQFSSFNTDAFQNQEDCYRINFWENARTSTGSRTDNPNASIRYNASTSDGGDGSIRFANESGTRILYMNRLGNGGTSGSWSTGSDQRKKDNITTVTDALNKVNQLRGVDFNWKERYGGYADSGVIAQEVESVLPHLVITQDGARDKDDDGNVVNMKNMNYNGLWGVMIEAVKELSTKNDALAAEVEQLKSQLNN